jgi:hypothetical protein
LSPSSYPSTFDSNTVKINASKQSQSPNTPLHYNHENNTTMDTSLEGCILINKVATS